MVKQINQNLERWICRSGAIISATITVIGIAVVIPEDADAFTEDGLTGEPCATEVSYNYVEEVSIKPSLEEKE